MMQLTDELRTMFENSFGRKLTLDEEKVLIFTWSRTTVYWVCEQTKEAEEREREREGQL